MNAYEYALRSWEMPPLKEAVEICKNVEELWLLKECLLSKRRYHMNLSVINCSKGEQRKVSIKYAEIWGTYYLSELKELETMQ